MNQPKPVAHGRPRQLRSRRSELTWCRRCHFRALPVLAPLPQARRGCPCWWVPRSSHTPTRGLSWQHFRGGGASSPQGRALFLNDSHSSYFCTIYNQILQWAESTFLLVNSEYKTPFLNQLGARPVPTHSFPRLHFKGFFLHSQLKMTTAMILLITVKIADCSQKVFFLATNWQLVYSASSYYCILEVLWLHHKVVKHLCFYLSIGTSTTWGGMSTSSFLMKYGLVPPNLNNKESRHPAPLPRQLCNTSEKKEK